MGVGLWRGMEFTGVVDTLLQSTRRWKICSSSSFVDWSSLISSDLLQTTWKLVCVQYACICIFIRPLLYSHQQCINLGLNNLHMMLMMAGSDCHAVNFIAELKNHKELWHVEYMPAERGVGAGAGFVLCHTKGHGTVLFMYTGSQINLPTMGHQRLSWVPVGQCLKSLQVSWRYKSFRMKKDSISFCKSYSLIKHDVT